MRIIKEGLILGGEALEPTLRFRGECHRCGCEFEMDRNEIQPLRPGSEWASLWVDCPCCRSSAYVTPCRLTQDEKVVAIR